MSRLLNKQHKEGSAAKAYADCFVLLTKHYYDASDAASREQLTETYRVLVNKFLTGRILAGSALNKSFLQTVFEKCPALAWSLHEPILKSFLAKTAAESESAASGGRSSH